MAATGRITLLAIISDDDTVLCILFCGMVINKLFPLTTAPSGRIGLCHVFCAGWAVLLMALWPEHEGGPGIAAALDPQRGRHWQLNAVGSEPVGTRRQTNLPILIPAPAVQVSPHTGQRVGTPRCHTHRCFLRALGAKAHRPGEVAWLFVFGRPAWAGQRDIAH
jgi:hypothetical protein